MDSDRELYVVWISESAPQPYLPIVTSEQMEAQ